ncbi:MAG: hypothetical protein ACE5FL_11605, partial [Myxococcota bacterium]
GPVTTSVFLIGDAGAPKLPRAKSGVPDALIDPVLSALARDVAAQVAAIGAENTAVVVLGDNVYPDGLPPVGHPRRQHAERVLEAQIAAIGEAQGMFTLGNHDWVQGKRGRGWEHAMAQAEYLSARAPNISLHPPDTCPGPDDVKFGDHLHLVFFDMWAAMYQINHPAGPQAHCTPAAGDGRLAKIIDGVLGDTGERRAVFISHPPMLTSGPHGGYFPWKEHVFPLRVFDRNLWIPLPVIGSIIPLARLLGVADTDLMSANYRLYLEGAKALFSPGHPTLVAAGHEHSLQIHVDPTGVFHAVSGAGSVRKVDFVRDMKSDLMALAAPGYMRLDVYEDASLRLNVLALVGRDEADLVYSSCIP